MGTAAYRNDPKFSDTQALANSADQDQTAPSDQGLHCLSFHLHFVHNFFCRKTSLFELKGDYSKVFWRAKI